MDAVLGTSDAAFDTPFVDVDEWRDDPVRHRYVHGGFEGTDCKFSLYFPPAERYQGRFFQPVMPVSGFEHGATMGFLAQMAGSIDFAVASGAYLVESNLGRKNPFPGPDSTIAGYRASAATARHSRALAVQMYGEHRPYGYVYGGSGGAYKTISCFENTDVWDGAVPFVPGSPMSLPNVFSVQAHAIRILRDKFPAIVDALEPGGSCDMYAGLNVEEREALAEVTAMGFPPRAWFDVERIARGYTGVVSMLADNIVGWDPEYFEDFWSVPGYLGHTAPDSLQRARLQHKTVVARPIYYDEAVELGIPPLAINPMAMNKGTGEAQLPCALLIDDLPDARLQGATLTVTSGKAAGRIMYVVDRVGDAVMTGAGAEHFEGLVGIEAGDEVLIDNSVYLALQTYHRHQVTPDYPVWDKFCVAGQPVYPQRERLMGPRFARQGSGSTMSGRFAGKMIVVASLMDEAAYPWQAAWYRRQVEAVLGDGIDDQYRLWFTDHALHTTPLDMPGDPLPARTTRVVAYGPVLQQALRDVSAWVERGIAPPPSSEFREADGQVFIPPTAAERGGVQPVVAVTANASARAEVAVGEEVTFTAVVEVPPGTGYIVSLEWDFEATGAFPVTEDGFEGDGGSLARATVTRTHAFTEPGTYFPALRATSQRQGDPVTPYARIQNLGRVRVVVS